MISRFELVALSAEERLAWETEQGRPGHRPVELNLRDAAIFAVFLTAVTLMVLLATYLTGDSMAVMPAWMGSDALRWTF